MILHRINDFQNKSDWKRTTKQQGEESKETDKEKNLKIKCCYVTNQRVEYSDEFVEILVIVIFLELFVDMLMP